MFQAKVKHRWLKRLPLLLVFLAGPLMSAETESVDIHVSIQATKSLAVGGTTYDFGKLNINTSSVTATAIVVTNDSTALIETFTLRAGDAISDTGGVNWVLSPSTGPNQYTLDAQFGTSRPNTNDENWTDDDLTTGNQICSPTHFGNGTPEESGENVSPQAGDNSRNLWFRIKTPSAVSDPSAHTATVTLAIK